MSQRLAGRRGEVGSMNQVLPCFLLGILPLSLSVSVCLSLSLSLSLFSLLSLSVCLSFLALSLFCPTHIFYLSMYLYIGLHMYMCICLPLVFLLRFSLPPPSYSNSLPHVTITYPLSLTFSSIAKSKGRTTEVTNKSMSFS